MSLKKESVLFADKLSEKLSFKICLANGFKSGSDTQLLIEEEGFKKLQKLCTSNTLSLGPLSWDFKGYPDGSRKAIIKTKELHIEIFSLEDLDEVRYRCSLGVIPKYKYQNFKNYTFQSPICSNVLRQHKHNRGRSFDPKEKVTGCIVERFDMVNKEFVRFLERSSKIFDKVTVAAYPKHEEQLEIINSYKYVDEVIDATYLLNTESLNKNDLDYLVFNEKDSKFAKEHYAEIINENRLLFLEKTDHNHTTHLKKRKDGVYYKIPFIN